MNASTDAPLPNEPPYAGISRIAVGIDGHREGYDAALLGATIAGVTGAELMLVAVHPDPLVVVPPELGWTAMHEQAEAVLRETRDALAPDARIRVETDWSVPRALERVAGREHRDLLVVGSSRVGPAGRVRVGTRTRQLLCHCRCGLAVAPRGLGERQELRLARIGVGYDGGPEAQAALSLAVSLALAADAQLVVRAFVDDRLPTVGWLESGRDRVREMWNARLESAVATLREDVDRALATTSAHVSAQARAGAPPEALLELSDQVDLLVIGSRRWGAAARVLLGSTGEALLHDARCAMLVAPRPDAS